MKRYKKQLDLIHPDDRFEENTVALLRTKIRKEENFMNIKKSTKTVIAIAVAAVLFTVSAFAGVRLLSADKVAEYTGNYPLAEAFTSAEAVKTDQSYTGVCTENGIEYTVRFLAAVRGDDISSKYAGEPYNRYSGESLDDILATVDQDYSGENYYFLLSLEHSDGTPISVMDEGVNPIYISPLVDGTYPWIVNERTLHVDESAYDPYYENGIMYYIISFEGFAFENMHLFAYEGIAPSAEKFIVDPQTGKISINPEFKGLITEFQLPEALDR